MATLLIVDDDNKVRETLNDLLAETHECHTADRAEQALAYLRSRKLRCDPHGYLDAWSEWPRDFEAHSG